MACSADHSVYHKIPKWTSIIGKTYNYVLDKLRLLEMHVPLEVQSSYAILEKTINNRAAVISNKYRGQALGYVDISQTHTKTYITTPGIVAPKRLYDTQASSPLHFMSASLVSPDETSFPIAHRDLLDRAK